MTSLSSVFKRPYPKEKTALLQWVTILGVSGFVFLFLFVFQPFGLSAGYPNKIWILAGYGLVTALVLILQALVWPAIFPGYYAEKHWTVGKEMLESTITLLLIAFLNFLYSLSVGFFAWDLVILLNFLFFTITVGVFPIFGMIFIHQYRLMKRYRTGSEELNRSIGGKVLEEHEASVTFHSDYGKDHFYVEAGRILYIEAADNYVQVFYRDGEVLLHELIRSSITKVEETLTPYRFLYRCHRSYIINLDRVKRVEGNSQGYKLLLEGTDVAIPVSRAKNAAFREKITH